MSDNNNTTPKPTEVKPMQGEVVEQKKYGVPVEEFNKLSLREQKDLEMKDLTSPLRNQDTVENIVDHQLITNAPAQTIVAMTGWSIAQLDARAKQLGTTLKGSLAGDFSPKG